ILDEPTAVLSPPEVGELWRVLRAMRARGETIVLITHKLDEVMEISDTVTVMRHGRTVGRMATASTTPAEIARALAGRAVVLAGDARPGVAVGAAAVGAGVDALPAAFHTPARGVPAVERTTTALAVRGLVVRHAGGGSGGGRGAAVDVTFDIAPGEILG